MTAAPAATSSVRDPRLGSRAGCGCCWRSWSSPPPRPWPAQVNQGFGPGTPRWPLSGPSALRPRGRPAPRLRPPEMRRRVRPGGAGAGEPAQGLGARGPPPGAVRAAGKDAPLGGSAHAAASHPFWRVTPLLVLLGLSGVAVRPAGAQCLVANPGSDQGQQTGCRGALASPLSALIPCPREAASTLHLQRRVWNLAGGIRRPEVPAKPVFPARVIFV